MLNHITVGGRLTKDPELRSTTSGKSVTSVTLACERDFKASDGSKTTDFIDVVAWGGTAEFIAKYFSKGRMAIVDGRLESRKWTDKDGNNRTSWEVIAGSVYFGDSKNESAPKEQTFAEEADDGELPF